MTTSKAKEKEYEFIATYTPKAVDEISRIMKRCDLGIEEVIAPFSYRIKFRSSAKVDLAYMRNMRNLLELAGDKSGIRLLSLEEVVKGRKI